MPYRAGATWLCRRWPRTSRRSRWLRRPSGTTGSRVSSMAWTWSNQAWYRSSNGGPPPTSRPGPGPPCGAAWPANRKPRADPGRLGRDGLKKRSRASLRAGPGTLELADLRPRDVTLGELDHVPRPVDAVALRAQRRRAGVGVQGVAVVGDDLRPACPGDHAEAAGEVVRGPGLGHAG